MNRNLLITLIVLALVGIVGTMYWQTSPQQRAERFLQELAEVASLSTQDNNLVRKAKSAKILRYVANPVTFDLESIRIDREAKHDTVSTGFLAVAFGASDFLVEFRDIVLLSSDANMMVVQAFLTTKSGFKHGIYDFEAVVRVKLVESDDGLRLASIVE